MKLRWLAEARHDLREIQGFIALDNAAAALAITTRIRRTARRVQDFPLAGQVVGVETLRATTVPGPSYRLVYRIQGDIVLIVAVWHGARAWPFGEA